MCRMCDPVIQCYGKGLLPAFCANPEAPLDIVSIILLCTKNVYIVLELYL